MNNYAKILTLAVCAAASTPLPAAAFEVQTTHVGPVVEVGQYPNYYGTDLGFSNNHGGRIFLHFGDTYKSVNDPFGHGQNDDGIAYFDIENFPNADDLVSLEWEGTAHVLRPFFPWNLTMGGAKTPVTSFGGMTNSWFTVYIRGMVMAKCLRNSDCSSEWDDDNLICDRSMGAQGLFGEPLDDLEPFLPCWRGHSQYICTTLRYGRGICRDPNSSVATFQEEGYPLYESPEDGGALRTEWGKIYSSAQVLEVGVPFSTTFPTYYSSRPFVTNKFSNQSARMTTSLDDYTPAESGTSLDIVAWTWGRPAFYSNSGSSARSELYLMAQMGSPYHPYAMLRWYVADVVNGAPVWSLDQKDAMPLDVDGADWEDGTIGHMSFTFMPEAAGGDGKWVMLYGGGSPEFWTGFFDTPATRSIEPSGGPIRMRTADHPWGPWSDSREVLRRDDPEISDFVCLELFGDVCMDAFDFPLHIGTGEVYAPSIVQAWDRSNGNNGTIGWFVSLWNPYEVHQMRTDITNLHVP